jgi:3-phosphoshikimate 1-carboxyvinyltransferase
MIIKIIPPKKVEGEINPPSSKSYTHRAIFASLLSYGKSTINNILICSDTEATLNAFNQFGGHIQDSNVFVGIGEPRKTEKIINCNNSGTTLRLACSISSLVKGITILTGSKSLCNRPIWPLERALNDLGVETISKNGSPPVAIKGGKIKGKEVEIIGNVSSQFVSGLLMIAPKIGLKIKVKGDLVSSTYVDLTIKVLEKFSIVVERKNNEFYVNKQEYKATELSIPSDISSASFFIAAGLLKGKVKLINTIKDPYQADSQFIDIIKNMNGKIYEGDKYIQAEQSNLEAIDVNCKLCPDIVPILSVLAAKAKGVSRIYGIEHLRFKESDRIKSIAFNLRKMGIDVKEGKDYLQIKGKEEFQGSKFLSFNDHRIAMAFSIASLAAKYASEVIGIECIKDSYPSFLCDLSRIGVKYNVR